MGQKGEESLFLIFVQQEKDVYLFFISFGLHRSEKRKKKKVIKIKRIQRGLLFKERNNYFFIIRQVLFREEKPLFHLDFMTLSTLSLSPDRGYCV